MLTQSTIERFNEWIGADDWWLPAPQLQVILLRIAKLLYSRNKKSIDYEADAHFSTLSKKPRKFVQNNFEVGRRMAVHRTADEHFLVSSREQYEVNTLREVCPFKHWQEMRVPCPHACTFLSLANMELWLYCS